MDKKISKKTRVRGRNIEVLVRRREGGRREGKDRGGPEYHPPPSAVSNITPRGYWPFVIPADKLCT